MVYVAKCSKRGLHCSTIKNNLSINVYRLEDEKKAIYSLCVTDSVVPDRHVDLLLHECNGDQHYYTIKDFIRLISGQLSNHSHAIYCCKKCLHAYSTKELLAAHAVDCCHVQHTKFPPMMSFYQHPEAVDSTLCSICGFRVHSKACEGVTQGVSTGTASSTTVYQEHEPCSFAYKVVSSVDPDFS